MLLITVALSVLLGLPAAAGAQPYSAEPAYVIDRATVDGNIKRLAFLPGGDRFVAVSLDHTVHIWTAEGRLVGSIDAHTSGVMGVAISPDGGTIVTAGLDGRLAVFGPEGGLRSTIKPGSRDLFAVALSPDGTKIACAAGHNVELWSTSGKRLAVLSGHAGPVVDVAFLPDGSVVSASGYYDHVIKEWSSTNAFMRDVRVVQGNILSFSVSADGTAYICGTDQGLVRVSRFDGGAPTDFRALRSFVFCPTALSADGSLALFASQTAGAVAVADLKNGTVSELGGLEGQTISALAFSPDGRYVAAGSTTGAVAVWRRSGD